MCNEPSNELPPTSLIICSRNRPKLLVEAVASILQGEQVPTELLVIDQSDAPHATLCTMTRVRTCTVRYVWTQSVGLSRANNLGIALAQYEILVFTHDDVLIAPNWFGRLVGALVQAGVRSVVTGQVRPTAGQQAGDFQLAIKVDPKPAQYAGRIWEDVIYPLNLALYRSALTEVGGFDERIGPGTPFPGAEDNDIGFRLLEAGYEILYVPEAVLYHCAWRPARDYVPLHWSYGRGQGAYYAKHLSLRDRYMLRRLVNSLKKHAALSLDKIWSDRREGYGEAAYALGMLSGALQWTINYGRYVEQR